MTRALLTIVLMAFAATASATLDPAKLRLASANALILDASAGRPIYAKAADEVAPIASLTKLMTAMVVLDAKQPLDETLEITLGDIDFLKGSKSRLRLGTALPRREMMRLALMSSENRAASSLARDYPGGANAFVTAMNAKARALGMTRSHFADATGLSPSNVSTANDLARLVRAAADYPLIREYSTTPSAFIEVDPTAGRLLGFSNSNRLVASHAWEITLQKTGYIREAGRCLVMMTNIASKPVVIVLLDSVGKYSRLGDAERVKHWLETGESMPEVIQRVVTNAPRAGKRNGPVRGTLAPRIRVN
ncbi:MAG TPA: D-alanyl-D-alanine endopeptidase [Casimicrobiaceae bacterium]|nr:D-alanyl-D-alanine endopeptidase [Casimicrobiaceae bacterium]